MDHEAACRSGQEAAAPHASDVQDEVGIAEAPSRPGACRLYSSTPLSRAQSERTELFVMVMNNLLCLEAMSHVCEVAWASCRKMSSGLLLLAQTAIAVLYHCAAAHA